MDTLEASFVGMIDSMPRKEHGIYAFKLDLFDIRTISVQVVQGLETTKDVEKLYITSTIRITDVFDGDIFKVRSVHLYVMSDIAKMFE